MTDQLPERFFGIPFKDDESAHWLGQFWSVRCSEDDIEFLPADTAIPKAEADAMVAAAIKRARYIAHIAWGWPESEASSMPVCEAISEITPADARAAFEQAVQEAVKAERERWSKISRENYDAFCAMRNDINEIIGDMPSAESALERGPELSHEMQQVVESVARFAASIRASQETSE